MIKLKVPTVKLWCSPGACSFVSQVALCEAGIEADLVLAKVGAMTEGFQAVNPKRRVPVLASVESIINENR
jgi:Glutathione S-transferase